MIAYIKGELAEVEENALIIESGNIGYRVFISTQTLSELPAVGAQIKLHTYFNVREDAMQLYGFLTRDDLEVFQLLLNVNGIGPKAALGVLSGLSADDLRFAVLRDDAKAIAKAPGIGGKTAQKIILELKDKLRLEDAFERKLEHNLTGKQKAVSDARDEAVQALVALGYSSTDALHAVKTVDITEDMDVEAILKGALKKMSFL